MRVVEKIVEIRVAAAPVLIPVLRILPLEVAGTRGRYETTGFIFLGRIQNQNRSARKGINL
jgi:hypothetical protein